MKKQLVEHIFNLVKHGHDVAVKYKDGGYAIIKGMNPDGALYGTSLAKTIEECKKDGIFVTNWLIQEIQECFTNEYEIVTEPPILYKAGDLVDILPIAKEVLYFVEDWGDGTQERAQEMVGQKGVEIKFYHSDGGLYEVYTKDKSHCYIFPHWCLAPHFQEEPDDKMEEAMELLKKNGYKVIKENNE